MERTLKGQTFSGTSRTRCLQRDSQSALQVKSEVFSFLGGFCHVVNFQESVERVAMARLMFVSVGQALGGEGASALGAAGLQAPHADRTGDVVSTDALTLGVGASVPDERTSCDAMPSSN